jgi:hypothetical protein
MPRAIVRKIAPDLPAREIEHQSFGRLGAWIEHLAERRLDDPDLDALRDLDLDLVVDDLGDPAADAAGGDDLVALLDRGDHRLVLLHPLLLRPDHQQIEDHEDQQPGGSLTDEAARRRRSRRGGCEGQGLSLGHWRRGSFQLQGKKWSGRLDSNQRPPHPQCDALPGCATPRPVPRWLAGDVRADSWGGPIRQGRGRRWRDAREAGGKGGWGRRLLLALLAAVRCLPARGACRERCCRSTAAGRSRPGHHRLPRSNGIHVDIVMPARAQGLDWRPLLPPSDFRERPADGALVRLRRGRAAGLSRNADAGATSRPRTPGRR